MKPATPLPWKSDKWTSHAPRTVLIDDDACITGKRVVAECEEATDAAYVVHACNAYPRLIEALKGARETLGRYWFSDVDGESYNNDDAISDSYAIDDILRELGERT